jgi:Domain of unknown function (DUF4190)
VVFLQQPSRRPSGDVDPRRDQPAVGSLRETANGLRQTPAARTNPSAIAALVCGVLAFCGLAPIGIAAVILGHKALSQIRRTGQDGYGLARAGLVLGYLALALAVLGLLVMLAFSHTVAGAPPAQP